MFVTTLLTTTQSVNLWQLVSSELVLKMEPQIWQAVSPRYFSASSGIKCSQVSPIHQCIGQVASHLMNGLPSAYVSINNPDCRAPQAATYANYLAHGDRLNPGDLRLQRVTTVEHENLDTLTLRHRQPYKALNGH